MPMTLGDAVQELQGKPLSSVEFVQDYIQLRFDGPCLTAYTLPVVSSGSNILTADSFDYRNQLCTQIGHVVVACRAEIDELLMKFDDGVEIRISLRDDDYRGAEALEFISEDGHTWVV